MTIRTFLLILGGIVVAWVVGQMVSFGQQAVDLERACFELEQLGHTCL